MPAFIRVGSVVCAALLAILAGCAGNTSEGTAYAVGIDRQLRTTFPDSLETVHTVALEVVTNDLLYTITNEARDARQGVIRATTAKTYRVKIETTKVADAETEIQIFVGPVGDTDAALEILTLIEVKLNELRGYDAVMVEEVVVEEVATDADAEK